MNNKKQQLVASATKGKVKIYGLTLSQMIEEQTSEIVSHLHETNPLQFAVASLSHAKFVIEQRENIIDWQQHYTLNYAAMCCLHSIFRPSHTRLRNRGLRREITETLDTLYAIIDDVAA